jgi:hypothetical protein
MINKFLHEAISRAARGKTKTSYGYTWEFKDKITT